MGLFDTIRRAVGGGDSSTDGDETTAGGDRASDDGPELLDTATLDPPTFREYAERVVDGADPLTFDPDALARLDTAIEESYDGKTVGDAASVTTYTENTVRFGSYLGELLVRAYDGKWVQSDGRWGVAVTGPDDEVGVAVFDVAARSFADKPVFAAVVTRLESDLELDSIQSTDDDGLTEPDADETDADSVVSEPTRVVSRVDDGQADERDGPPEPTATDERSEATAGDTADTDSSQAIETEPTRIVRRVESESEGEDRPDDTDPTPAVSEAADEPENEPPWGSDDADGSTADIGEDAEPETTESASDDAGSEPSAAKTTEEGSTIDSSDAEPATEPAAEQSAVDTADEQPTAETPASDSTFDAAEDGPTADTTDAVETTADADDTADMATADEAAAYIDEAEPTADSATADPSDEAPAAETLPEDSAIDTRDEDRTVDAPAGAATDTSADEAVTDTADDGAAGTSIDDESKPDISPDASSDVATDAEAVSETTGDESPADTADAAGVDDTPAAVAESDAVEQSDDRPDTSAPVGDVEASDATETAPSQDATADETPDTAAADEREQPASTGSDSTAGSMARSWEPGTVRADHADTAVEFADFWGEHDLDFSPASLSRLDDLVDAEWDDERFAETTFGSDDSFDDRAFTSVVRELGGYFGEVLVRQLDGKWTDETDHEAAVVVGGPGGQFAIPVFEVAITSLRKQAVFGRSYDALLEDLGRDGPTR
ncbi:hypothetical protein JZX76_13220 [Haloarcula hispanica]|uniref:Uncharacterized protein n=1 Tax=Haloarcula hispanica TaxID=51589 RepID=A0A482T334_HALHI|nr:hypothetical protein [Haloarcula hispanica]MCJ0620430.1 hypothetical protein [Haloarcula hispanica]RYJ10834.1 hypothetical protein ELS20_13120 [Haloarcula hispanica]